MSQTKNHLQFPVTLWKSHTESIVVNSIAEVEAAKAKGYDSKTQPPAPKGPPHPYDGSF